MTASYEHARRLVVTLTNKMPGSVSLYAFFLKDFTIIIEQNTHEN